MQLTETQRHALVEALAGAMIEHADELTRLDQAIGDGDHGINMQRGFAAVLAQADRIAALPLPETLAAIGTTLVMQVGGASGPLYGTLFLRLGKALPERPTLADCIGAAETAIAAVKARGKSDVGCKTLLDVLVPTLEALKSAPADADLPAVLTAAADAAALATVPLRALRGRAAYLGERSIGHMDPGARSAALLIGAACTVLPRGGMSDNVGIVIVSHSPDVARGAADMVRQMVGADVPLAWCGGAPGGGLGCSVPAIVEAIGQAWSERGVAILVDLGGAQTNSEMAVELLPVERRGRVVICDAPIVEGAVVAAAEASGGATLEQVRATAEEM
jgi:dihydroxyacetone kinase-like protein